jgi:3-hydroxy-3-methylglutaryl CoA synthase/uncharacterized OB-fold protein
MSRADGTRGIAAAGVHVPRFRLEADELSDAWGHSQASGVESKAVAGADEDAVTMGIAAAEDALANADLDPADVSFLGLATTTPPLAEEELAPRLVKALGLPESTATRTATASPVSAAQVIEDALDADGPALAIAADAPEGDPADADHAFGAAGVALVIDDDPAVAITDVAHHSDEYPGIRFRQRGREDVETLDITTYQRTAMRESTTAVLEALDVDLESAAAAAVYQPDGGIPYRITGDVPLDSAVVHRGVVADAIGDAGAAGVPLGLVAALEDSEVGEGDTTVAAFFGGGGSATGFALEGALGGDRTAAVEEGEPISYATYVRERGYVVEGEVAGGGAHVSLPSWRRSLDQRYRLAAGRCPECGAYAFPPEGACPACHELVEFERVEMPRTGTVAAVTIIGQGGAPPEFVPQQDRDGAFGVAIVELDDGEGTVELPAQLTDCDPDDVEVGDEVAATIRRIYEQEGLPRYGVKFTPAE